MNKTLVGVVALAAVIAGACTSNGTETTGEVRKVPQPVMTGLSLAAESKRVDLEVPKFSNPTEVTNPLFPISKQESVLLLGRVDGQPFRTEVTLLPDTRSIEWQGQRIEALVSQYHAYLDGRIHEIAYDFYAQDDAGAVWYLGEDVFNFEDGVIVDTHGTWIAGRDGPGAMIMPAHPQVGDAYRPENIPGLVFEEVTVKEVGKTLDGPFGTIENGILINELHMDGTTEEKTFAPGYGEFFTGGGGDVEATALAVPTDRATGPVPAELTTLSTSARAIFDAAGSRGWDAAAAEAARVTSAWEAVKRAGVPKLIEPVMTRDVRALNAAVAARDIAEARQAAIDVARSGFDLQLRYRPVVEIDLARFDLWLAQHVVDAAARDEAAVNGDFFTLDYIRDRILHAVEGGEAQKINTELEGLLIAVGDADFAAVRGAATKLRATIAKITPVG